MNCYICGEDKIKIVHKGTRDRKEIDVLQCEWCGLKFLSNYPTFDHIDNNFYEASQMRAGDKEKEIEEMLEAAKEDDDRRYEYLRSRIFGRRILDFGCGAGGFLFRTTKEDKTAGLSYKMGIEPEEKVRKYLMSHNIPVFRDLQHCIKMCGEETKFDYITMFHTLEHLKDPKQTLRDLKQLLYPRGKIIIEVPHTDDALMSMYECEAFQDFTFWSCHLYLFNLNSFDYIARELGMTLEHKYIQRYPISNHIYWLMSGRPGGQNVMGFLNDERLMEEYNRVLEENEVTDTLIVELANVV